MAKIGFVAALDAEDLGAGDIPPPSRELRSSNDQLGDSPHLRDSFEANGYLLFRSVLDIEAVTATRRKMLAVLIDKGMVAGGGDEPIWTGADWGDLNEDSPEFGGLGETLATTPHNAALFNEILGESATLLPIVQYRFYPPTYPLGMPHQDGYFTQVGGFVGLWIPLADIDRSMGGLAVAVGQNHRGYLHNASKPPPSPIPRHAIPAESWHAAEYRAGDLLMLHHATPHCALPNHSNRLRLSLDLRLIPASNAQKVFTGAVVAALDDSITLRSSDGRNLTLMVDDESFVRCGRIAVRIPRSQLPIEAPPGTRIMALHDGTRATMLRRASSTIN